MLGLGVARTERSVLRDTVAIGGAGVDRFSVVKPGVARRQGTFFCFAKRKYPKKRRPQVRRPSGTLRCSQTLAAAELAARMVTCPKGVVCARHSDSPRGHPPRLLRFWKTAASVSRSAGVDVRRDINEVPASLAPHMGPRSHGEERNTELLSSWLDRCSNLLGRQSRTVERAPMRVAE